MTSATSNQQNANFALSACRAEKPYSFMATSMAVAQRASNVVCAARRVWRMGAGGLPLADAWQSRWNTVADIHRLLVYVITA